MTAVVLVYHPRADARRAVRRGIPDSSGGGVRVCRSAEQLRRLMVQRLIGAVVVDVKSAPADVFNFPARFPRIPFYALSAFKPEDGAILARCREVGFAGVLVEGVDNAVAGEWIASRTAESARRDALAEAPRLLRLSEPIQRRAWTEVLGRAGRPTTTAQVAQALDVTREYLSRQFGAGGAPNLKRVIDLARVAWAADLLGNPGYPVGVVARMLAYASSGHLAAAARRVAGVPPGLLAGLGAKGVLGRFVRGHTRSRE
ncbi:MAG TPA: helix-turn-helix domain-containing protein [Gemmatimonadales bacterium]|nr:helix-turn-helix domain-containing protein [Gemmatimonadales bacterium]